MSKKSRILMSLVTVLALAAGSTPGFASSHREASNITKTPKVDNTNV